MTVPIAGDRLSIRIPIYGKGGHAATTLISNTVIRGSQDVDA
jgi:hypothetical protein